MVPFHLHVFVDLESSPNYLVSRNRKSGNGGASKGRTALKVLIDENEECFGLTLTFTKFDIIIQET